MARHLVLAATLLLALAERQHAAPIFAADWAQCLEKFPGQWSELHAMEKSRLQAGTDPTSPRAGAVVRVEVRPGDKVGGWTGERAEVCAMRSADGSPLPVKASRDHEYYALSVKPDAAWQPPQPNAARETWGTFFQLHGPDRLHAPPSFALMAEKDFHVNLCGGDLLNPKTRNPVSYPLTDGALHPGAWTEFLLDVVWAADATGSVTIYRRNKNDSAWTKVLEKQGLATLQHEGPRPVEDHYWKAGFYRSESPVATRLWLGPIARGANRDDVAVAAFGRH